MQVRRWNEKIDVFIILALNLFIIEASIQADLFDI